MTATQQTQSTCTLPATDDSGAPPDTTGNELATIGRMVARRRLDGRARGRGHGLLSSSRRGAGVERGRHGHRRSQCGGDFPRQPAGRVEAGFFSDPAAIPERPAHGHGMAAVGRRLQPDRNAPLYFAAGEPPAQKFTRLAAQSQRDSLAARSALLQLWAASITSLLPACGANPMAHNLRERFRQFVGRMPEAELAMRSLTQLAGELHCSERHFSRLFREEFHVSLRTRQTELRLQRARQLLADSDAKIINVAYESGYRHLGLFNAMFKKRFGVTPSAVAAAESFRAAAKFCQARRARAGAAAVAAQTSFSPPQPARNPRTPPRPSRRPRPTRSRISRWKNIWSSGNTVLTPGQLGPDFHQRAGGVRHQRHLCRHPGGAGGFADGVSRARVCDGVRRPAAAEAHQRHGEDQGDRGPARRHQGARATSISARPTSCARCRACTRTCC